MLRLLILETDVTDKLVNIFKAKRTNHVTLVCVFILHLKEKMIWYSGDIEENTENETHL